MPKISIRSACTLFSVFTLAACGGSGSNQQPIVGSELAAAPSFTDMLVLSCSGCHAADNGAIASLTLYDEELLRQTLIRYKTETDGTSVMHRLARGYSETEIKQIAAQLGQPMETP